MNTYPSYKDSDIEWMGDIPDCWKLTKNRFGFRKHKNGLNESDDTNVLSLTTTGVKVKRDLNFGKTSESYIGHQLVEQGDIVFTPRDFDQTPILSDVSKYKGCISNLYIVDKTKEDVLNRYVNYYWHGLKYSVDYFKNFSHGMRYSFNRFQFDEIPLLIPPLQEQQQISDYLDYKTSKVDTLIEKTQQKIGLLKEQRTSLINTTVTKGLNPDVDMKDSGVEWIGEIPSEWEVVKLKFVGKVIIGLSYSPDNVVDEGEGTLVMRSTNVQNGKPSFHDNVYVDKDIPDRMVTREGDILICSRNGSRNLIGKNCIISKDIEGMSFGVFMTIFRSKYWKLIYWVLNSPVFKSQSGLYLTSTINQLTVSTIKNLTIPFTFNESEQEQIVDYLDNETSKIDKLVDTETKRINLLKEYRQSLISEVVTGKVDVRDEVLV